ncbi:hypothetical protein C8Q80DRAFT_1269310 [Daedaleopsis nitida]|nr:hypothetical protein C8Q80DRAFT_1269310 [Daedaleopsis nitida]
MAKVYGNDDGYVEDSEEEDSMVLDLHLPPPIRKGLPPPPQVPIAPPLPDDTVSSIETPNFTEKSPNHRPPPAQSNDPHTTTSSIETTNLTTRSVVSDISSFGPMDAGSSSVHIDSSISSFTPAQPPTKKKPRPRPVVKRKDGTEVNSSISNGTPSSLVPSSDGTPFPYLRSMPPPPPPVQPLASSSLRSFPPTATTVLATPGTQRSSDSGVDMGVMDIAERAKLRSRARSQAKGKQAVMIDDVIELSSSDDEFNLLPASYKGKAKSKPKKPAASKPSASSKAQAKAKPKPRDTGQPSPPKRAKTIHVSDSGFESDINTIPMLTSDYPAIPLAPPHLQHLNSQLPPSDPPSPPSTSGSSSAQSAPRTSQSRGAPDIQRGESPLSSPPPPMPRKRKRPPPVLAVNAEDSDFGADEDSILAGVNGLESVVAGKGHKKGQERSAPPPPPGPSPEFVPDTQAPALPKSKPSARRKRKVGDDEEEWGGEPADKPSKARKKARAEEEDEEEWGGDGPSKSKPKGKKAAKKAPAKEKVPKEKASKAKPAAKGKTPTSKEIIVDLDEEEVLVTGGNGPRDRDGDKAAMPPPAVPDVAASKQKEKGSAPSNKHAETTDPAKDPSDTPAVSKKSKGKQRAIVLSDDEDDDGANAADVSTHTITDGTDSPAHAPQKKGGRKSSGSDQGSKENDAPTTPAARPVSSSASSAAKPAVTPTPTRSGFAHANRAYTIGSKKTKSTPMSELIRRVSSLPGSPFPASSRPTYSPLAKASKATLRRIAPLHPNRRTPPPPPPRAPPKPKSKKMLEMEEKWEMELEESIEGWFAMSEGERAQLRRAKRDHELGFED